MPVLPTRFPHVVFPLGAGAVTVEFGNRISSEINRAVLALDAALNAAPFHGFTESVPAYASLTVFFDPLAVRSAYTLFPTAFAAVAGYLEDLIGKAAVADESRDDAIVVPVDFSAQSAPDLEAVAARAGLSRDEAIGLFVGREYRVFMLGFLPGFAYMGEVDERIAAPRLDNPRLSVPAGSVGIAGKQTGIYPVESPGGWQIIGRTAVRLFDPDLPNPALLGPGDRVRFVEASV